MATNKSPSTEPALGPPLDSYHVLTTPALMGFLLVFLISLIAVPIIMFGQTIIALIVWGGLMIGLGWYLWQATGKTVIVHLHGLTLTTRRGQTAVAWTDIQDVAAQFNPLDESLKRWRLASITIRSTNEHRLYIPRLSKGMRNLLQLIQRKTTYTIRNHYLPRIQQRETLPMGRKLTISPAGVRYGLSFVPWPKIKHIQSTPSIPMPIITLQGENKQPLLNIQAHEVNNAHVLQAILTQYQATIKANPPTEDMVAAATPGIHALKSSTFLEALLNVVLFSFFGFLAGGIISLMLTLRQVAQTNLSNYLMVSGIIVGGVIGILQFRAHHSVWRNILVLGFAAFGVAAMFAVGVTLFATAFFPRNLALIFGTVVFVVLTAVFYTNKLHSRRGQAIFRAVSSLISAILSGYLVYFLLQGWLGALLANGIAIVLGLVVGITMLGMPFAELLNSNIKP
ncbi:MAG: hypothetical protein H6655_16870 [Ardenticatenaceae bacterium]|nr:hypothetical protein [Ardenticatenaceae bacterium]